jgi:hypothetical protein
MGDRDHQQADHHAPVCKAANPRDAEKVSNLTAASNPACGAPVGAIDRGGGQTYAPLKGSRRAGEALVKRG